ncbi:transporter [Afipia sp. P52-10]|uniref:AI-2E family transporter n=1 Tax=Afipia sp. P52-10 TaxID=1429916 RepID=UPI0003DEF6A5|nr:AI-2E family transporter [Afipia sp. P52-10]ETR76594.1 transporter [Afipia sp. P52-10]
MVVPAGFAFTNLLVGAVVVASLYLAREILIPIVLAVLLTFVLSPLVTLLQRWRCPRTVAILFAVTFALAVILSLGGMVATQVNQLAGELPQYQATLREKAQKLREMIGGPGILQNATVLLNDLGHELDKPDRPADVRELAPSATPIPVEIHQPVPGVYQRLVTVVSPLVSPLATTGVVLLFTIFFLFQREDLRNRFVRVAGAHDIDRTTVALNDAGSRLQRLFATQLALNAGFGIIIGTGLALIGVPNAPLWGLLAMILRFVPYIGALLSALLPLALAAAVGSWSMVLATLLLFLVVEPIIGQIIEPLVYGQSSGLSPVAVVVSAAFWTWLWGPLGLLVSTPLTICLVVLSRHVERLKFIDIMLGDEPPLTPQQMIYQRMLADDPVEASELATRTLKKMPLLRYYDDVLVGALRLAESDMARGRLDSKRLENILDCVREVVDDLAGRDDPEPMPDMPARNARSSKVVRLPDRDAAGVAVILPGRSKLDAAAVAIVADVLRRQGLVVRPSENITPELTDLSDADVVCVCHLSPFNPSLMRYTARRLARTAETARLLMISLGSPNDETQAAEASLDNITSLHMLVERVKRLDPPPAQAAP